MLVANWLSIKELCIFDTAINNKQLRGNFLSGLSSGTFLYAGADVDERRSSEWQQTYAQWLNMRRVFVNSITLNKRTMASSLLIYGTVSGLVTLTIHGDVNFPEDIAARNVETLHRLELSKMGGYDGEEGQKFLRSVREWGSKGGSLEELKLVRCTFGYQVVNFGKTCDALIALHIEDCSSSASTTPVDSLNCGRLLWGILSKCRSLKQFEFSHGGNKDSFLHEGDLCLLARFCPNLECLRINTLFDNPTAAVLYTIGKCTKIQHLGLEFDDAIYDSIIAAVAANLVALRSLKVHDLRLAEPRTLRCLAHGCQQLQELSIVESYDVTVSEAELLELVERAKNLQRLTIGKWEHLDFRDTWEEEEPQLYDQHEQAKLVELGIEDAAAFISAQQERVRIIRDATPQPRDTVDRLRAASSNPHFQVILVNH
ncbi:hypothetical protein B484DRAFT_395379 [Ochromonadaceae sp. CCMP2298]|nr:hypothetical protein B484DRAFT_395379 [Ochromonadaceae sp. CCMP2298]